MIDAAPWFVPDHLLAVVKRLRGGPAYQRLDRPSTVGDGISRLDDADAEAWARAADTGRISSFIPASGAATRMFGDYVPDPRLPFASGSVAHLPKGLVPFHRYPDGSVRTAFAEQCVEAAAVGSRAAHFTVSREHRTGFEAAAAGLLLRVTLSEQDPGTDAPCIRDDGSLVYGDDGRLVLRPAGHGALLSNLEHTGGDLVLIKNIDNVTPDWHRGAVAPWRRKLVGRLVRLQDRAHTALAREDGEAAAALCREALGLDLGNDCALERLHRPWRVCGMVPNVGEPGGGPFHLRSVPGAQIVERAQIDTGDPDQAGILARSTHFNPVDLVCGLRDHRDRPFSLADYVDPTAVIITRKTVIGAPATVMERPGLWNGGMARWNTVFVELPAHTFNPVKTAADLLRPRHQPA